MMVNLRPNSKITEDVENIDIFIVTKALSVTLEKLNKNS